MSMWLMCEFYRTMIGLYLTFDETSFRGFAFFVFLGYFHLSRASIRVERGDPHATRLRSSERQANCVTYHAQSCALPLPLVELLFPLICLLSE